ncbi:MAG: TSUP family transporter, partial [Planctomycetes bacterium]|nr:TSUP family transporter [Planctomycetota bacterium]
MMAIGSAAGLVGGLLGVGGSIVMIPAMTELLGPQQHLYQAAAMMVNLFVVIPAVYQHARANAIRFEVVRWIVPAAMVSVVIGVRVSEHAIFAGDGQRYLIAVFGLFLFYVTGYQVWKLWSPANRGEVVA